MRRGFVCMLVAAALAGPFAAFARADGDASSAAAFLENAQNKDGGFGEHRHGHSSAGPTLWATVGLLAAGKNPHDEFLNGGDSSENWIAKHLSSYTTLTQLGLLALVQGSSQASPGRYGDPAAKLRAQLQQAGIVTRDSYGAALAILGLLEQNDAADHDAAVTAARALLAAPLADGGWGKHGLSDSASTALVLQSLAAAGVADSTNAVVKRGIDYLHQSQSNDGSIATSIRADQATSNGDVTATAFTLQAIYALKIPQLRTSTGTTVRQGLASYQQRSSGGLSSFGAFYSDVSPSVTQTAQAYPAFDGKTFPLQSVPVHTGGPPKKVALKSSNRLSTGTSKTGVSSLSGTGPKVDAGAFKQASIAGSKSSKGGSPASGAGNSVTGAVVGAQPPPRLKVRAGARPAPDHSALYLAFGLLGLVVLGGVVDARRPRTDDRSRTVIAVAAGTRLLSAARARGALAPAAVLSVGVLLALVPAATGMWSRAPHGAKMISAFRPQMTSAHLTRLRGEVQELHAGIGEALQRGPALQFPKEHSSEQALRRFLGANPEFALFANQWPGIDRRLQGLIDPVYASRGDFAAAAALPSFDLFPLFFLIPGLIAVALGAAGLARAGSWRTLRRGVLVTGVLLVAAPLALQMFGRTSHGTQLLSTFRPIETRARVTALQNDFGSLALGQGGLRTEIVPALRHAGATPAQVAAQLPAATRLNADWDAILGDLTPLLGVMSDNVANYNAILALPDLTIFPWLFLLAGIALVAIAVLSPQGRLNTLIRRVRAPAPQTT